MSDDIVRRLAVVPPYDNSALVAAVTEARAEIERLRAENDELRFDCEEWKIENKATNEVLDQSLAENNRLRADKAELLAALKLTEFGLNYARCPVCAGFDGKGENDRVHLKTCPVAATIAKMEGK